jgi:hypothetical protein
MFRLKSYGIPCHQFMLEKKLNIPPRKLLTLPVNSLNVPANGWYLVWRKRDFDRKLTGYRGIWASAGTEGSGRCVLTVASVFLAVDRIGLIDGDMIGRWKEGRKFVDRRIFLTHSPR